MKFDTRFALAALALAASLWSCDKIAPAAAIPGAAGPQAANSSMETHAEEYVLGTVCAISVPAGAPRSVFDEVFSRFREIEGRMSANLDGTEIDAVNKASGGDPVPVSEDTFSVIKAALGYAALSDGAFDPTVGPLVKLWKIGFDGSEPPPAPAIAERLTLVGWRSVELDAKGHTVRLAKKGMALDLGAIAKGYAADEAARILSSRGVRAAIIDLGGNVFALGAKPDGKPWRIGVQDPFGERGTYLGVVTTGQTSMVSSGVYEKFFMKDGKRYHHILDTKTGYPIVSELWQVTIIGPKSIDCDGYSTTLFCMGPERGMEYAKTLTDIGVIFVNERREIRMNAAAARLFELSDDSFRVMD